MTIRQKQIDGQMVLSVDTANDFARALESDLTIEAPAEIGVLFGFPDENEAVATLNEIQPGSQGEGTAYLLPGE